jgi:hypothetical protein
VIKPLELFHKNPRCRDGRASICKQCNHSALKVFRADPDKKSLSKEYARRAALRGRYGLETQEYEARLIHQQGKCFLCFGVNPSGRKLAVDHIAGTKIIRSLLCDRCNRGLGFFRHDPKLLREAAIYLEFFNAKR